MSNPLKQSYDALAARAQADSPFAGLDDRALPIAIVSIVQSVPTARVRALIAAGQQSPRPKDRYEARQLALVLFVQEELAKLPESIPVRESLDIMLDMLKDTFASDPR